MRRPPLITAHAHKVQERVEARKRRVRVFCVVKFTIEEMTNIRALGYWQLQVSFCSLVRVLTIAKPLNA